jgi:creatinine amidohydrolase
MKIADMHWAQVEAYLETDDRCVLPIGSTEQHAGLSLATDNILAERVALEAAEPLGIPVFPVLSYGLAPYFRNFPGSISIRVETYIRFVGDILDSLAGSGFKRILIVNGHGGNSPVLAYAAEWIADHPGHYVRLHNWWNAPQTWAAVQAIDPVASHASWMENFPWTRLAHGPMPTVQKPMIDGEKQRVLGPSEVRASLGDGNYGGFYQRADAEMHAIWEVAVKETRALLMDSWPY